MNKLNIRKLTMLLFGGAMVVYAIFVLAYASATGTVAAFDSFLKDWLAYVGGREPEAA